MKKIILVLFAVLTLFVVKSNVQDNVVIPEGSIRLRVIPNSNSNYDQMMKIKVKDYLESNIYSLFKDTDNIEDARELINDNIDNIKINIQDIFDKYDYNYNFSVNYGDNYFPKKIYKGVTYNEGYYESLVVSIGSAKGDNFWCVLFPNLCIIDEEDTEYTSIVKDVIDKIFSHKNNN